jgi:enolase
VAKIKQIWAREILDSRGIPTVEAVCQLDSGQISVSSVPAGTSTGTHEALELRDGDPGRYLGKGVLKAVSNVNSTLGPAIIGLDPTDQFGIDQKLIDFDGTEKKTKYGANALLAISMVVAKSGALAVGQNLYFWIYNLAQKVALKPVLHIPTPIFNMINGGLHGAGNLDFQEFHVIPASNKSYSESLRMGVEVYMTIGQNLARRGAIHSVGDEGGYAPNLFTNADALEVFVESIKQTKYSIGRDIFLGLDVAANSFYKNGEYIIKDKSSPLDDSGLLEYYKNLKDPYFEDAWASWKKILETLPLVTIVGDDLLATNPERLKKAINEKACNAILVKPNQVGTVSETIKVVKMAKEANWKIITSHRSGETNDAFIADFAVGLGTDYVKFGAPARGERVAKYNRLSAIEMELTSLRK